MREAGKEHVLNAKLLCCLAEGAQALLVEIVERLLTHGDLIRFREEHGDGQKRFGVRVAHAAGLLLQGERAADVAGALPERVVFEQREVVRRALLGRDARADGVELVGRQRDCVDPFAQRGVRKLVALFCGVQKAVDLHDVDTGGLAPGGLAQHGGVHGPLCGRHGQRIARKACVLPRQRRAVVRERLARAEDHDIKRIFRLEVEAVDILLLGGVVHGQQARERAVEQRRHEQKRDDAHDGFGFETVLVHNVLEDTGSAVDRKFR